MVPGVAPSIENFLRSLDDPHYWRKLPSSDGKEEFVLTKKELQILDRIQRNEYADLEYNPYQPYEDFFTRHPCKLPLATGTEPKRRFVLSRWESKRIAKIVKAIRAGTIGLKKDAAARSTKRLRDLWKDAPPAASNRLRAPKTHLPGNDESYNPPDHLLPSEEERKVWEETLEDQRTRPFLTRRYAAMRHIAGYPRLVDERFSRCLDLFLCPRAARKVQKEFTVSELVPELPSLQTLRPFPQNLALLFSGHSAAITALSLEPSTGSWLLSASKDGSVRLWEVESGRCQWQFKFDDSVTAVEWNPCYSIFAIAVGNKICFHSTSVLGSDGEKSAQDFLRQGTSSDANWTMRESVLQVRHDANSSVRRIEWHSRGDYIGAVSDDPNGGSVFVHQISRRSSIVPFKRRDGPVRDARFHPQRPVLYIASGKSVRAYELGAGANALRQKFLTGCNWLECIKVHPSGEHLLGASLEGKVVWMQCEDSSTPFKTMRYHRGAARDAAFHPSLPLFASVGDDGTVQIYHATVYEEPGRNPLIVPVHVIRPEAGATLRCSFHPSQPWLFVGCENGSITLYS